METLFYIGNILLALLPGLFWLWWYLRYDRRKPEPRRFLWKVFLLGMLVTIPALMVEFILDLYIPFSNTGFSSSAIIGAFLIIAPIEELAKFLIVLASVYRHKIFDERLDGVVYMVVAALGFATIENILVVISDGSSILPLRSVTATLLHALASGIIGYFLGLAKFSKRNKVWIILAGLIVGIGLHGLYDFIAISNSTLKISLLLLFMAVLFLILDFFVRNLQKKDNCTESSTK